MPNTSITFHHQGLGTSFYALSQDLQALIFEFLPLSDYPSLQLTCKYFNETLLEHPKLWAKHLFSKFINPSRDIDDILEEDIYDGIPLIPMDNFSFDQMKDSKAIIQFHYSMKSSLGAFLRQSLNARSSQFLTKALTDSFRTPMYPYPYLKRDIHFFETKTLFQNFLTEVYFGIQSRLIIGDKKQSLIKSIVAKLCNSYDVDSVTEGDLLLLQRCSSDQCQEIDQVEDESDGRQYSEATEEEEEEAESGQLVNVIKNGTAGLINFVEKFYGILYELARNRCDMVLTCLKAIKSQQGLLSEYCRQWFGFSLTIMEINRSLVPFSKFINELLREKCDESQNTPEFSIWKFMVKLWKINLFEPLSDRLSEAFLSILQVAREEGGDSKGSEATEQGRITRAFSDPVKSAEEAEVKSEESKLLSAFYNAVSDLSYDEFSIFYWTCTPISKETPKRRLDDLIVEGTLQYYKPNEDLWAKQPTQLLQLLKGDLDMIQMVFGGELSLRVRRCQLEFIRGFLIERLMSICDSLPNSPELLLSLPSRDYQGEDPEESFDVGAFERTFRALEAQGLMESKIGSSKGLKVALTRVLEKERRRLFHPLLTFSDKLNEELACSREENQEIYQELVEKGLGQADEDPEKDLLILINDDLEQHQAMKDW